MRQKTTQLHSMNPSVTQFLPQERHTSMTFLRRISTDSRSVRAPLSLKEAEGAVTAAAAVSQGTL